MSNAVWITLIICVTIIAVSLIDRSKSEKELGDFRKPFKKEEK